MPFNGPTRVCKRCQVEKPLHQFPQNQVRGIKYYRYKCDDCWNEWRRPYMKNYHEKYAGKYREEARKRHLLNKDERSTAMKRHYRKLKKIVFDHYGNSCACCGEQEPRFLTLDHVDDSGAQHRKKVSAGHILFLWIIDNNFPDFIRILCFNCNAGRYHNGGICPHVSNFNHQPSNWIV